MSDYVVLDHQLEVVIPAAASSSTGSKPNGEVLDGTESTNWSLDDTAIPSLRFPQKLWRIVNECTSGAISWGSNGQTVRINYKSFQREFLAGGASIFKTTNIASFIRQLNLYGFRKLATNTRDSFAPVVHYQQQQLLLQQQEVHEFIHEHFREARLDLLSRVCRKTGAKKNGLKRKAATSTTAAGVTNEVKTISTTVPRTIVKKENESTSFSRLQMCRIALTQALEQATLQYKREKLWLQLTNKSFFNETCQPNFETLVLDDNVKIEFQEVSSDSENNLQIAENFSMDSNVNYHERNQWQEVLTFPNDGIISISVPYF